MVCVMRPRQPRHAAAGSAHLKQVLAPQHTFILVHVGALDALHALRAAQQCTCDAAVGVAAGASLQQGLRERAGQPQHHSTPLACLSMHAGLPAAPAAPA